jgi:hypothetical protein
LRQGDVHFMINGSCCLSNGLLQMQLTVKHCAACTENVSSSRALTRVVQTRAGNVAQTGRQRPCSCISLRPSSCRRPMARQPAAKSHPVIPSALTITDTYQRLYHSKDCLLSGEKR